MTKSDHTSHETAVEEAAKSGKKGSSPRKSALERIREESQRLLAPAQNEDSPDAEPEPENAEWQKEFFANYRLQSAQIPRRFWNKTLENFEAKEKLRKDLVQAARDFVKGFNRDVKQGLLMEGDVGTGKSHLAVAILREIIRKGYSGLYYNSPDLLRDIRATFNDNAGVTEDDLLEEITEVDLLVLDDVGAEKVSEFVLDRFYLIINKRYEGCKPMILTTNLLEETLRVRLGDRIVSRLDEMCQRFPKFPKDDFRRLMIEKQRAI